MKTKWGATITEYQNGVCAKCGRISNIVVGVNAQDFTVYARVDPAHHSYADGPIVRFLCPNCVRG